MFLIRRVGVEAFDSDTSWSITALERNCNFLSKATVLEVKVVLCSPPANIFTWLLLGNPIWVSVSPKWNIDLAIPTSPPSMTENTSAESSYKFNISPEPLCVIIPAATLSSCASTLNNSTSLKVVFNVVKSPFAVRFPPITKLPLISPFPF